MNNNEILPTISTRVAVIINMGSGSIEDPDLVAEANALFVAHGIEPELCTWAGGSEIRGFAEEALHLGCNVIVAGGGDGTVSTVASVVAGTDAALGVLPLGTLNHFAKDLGLPLDLKEAVATIAGGHVVQVDLGEVNGRTFINNSGLGLYPRIVRHREGQQRIGRSKWWALFRAVLTVLGRFPLLKVRLDSPETGIFRRTPFIFIGNNEYQIHGLNIGTRARIDSGALSVYLTREVGRLRLLGLALRGVVGRLRDAEDFDAVTTPEMVVDARGSSIHVALDGEVVLLQLPLHYRCRPHDLRVIVRGT